MTTQRLQFAADVLGSIPSMEKHVSEQPCDIFAGTEGFLQDKKTGEFDHSTHGGLITYTFTPPVPGSHDRPKVVMTNNLCGGMGGSSNVDTNKLLLSTKDNVNFRLFLTEMTDLANAKFQNRFAKLLRCLGSKQTLHIHTGNGVYGMWPLFDIGIILDAMTRTQCKVIVHINGRASFCETCLWLFTEGREISEFGTLFFCGMQRHLEWSPNWRGYLCTILDRAVDLGVLTTSEKDSLLTTNKDLQLKQREVVARLNKKVETSEEPESTD